MARNADQDVLRNKLEPVQMPLSSSQMIVRSKLEKMRNAERNLRRGMVG